MPTVAIHDLEISKIKPDLLTLKMFTRQYITSQNAIAKSAIPLGSMWSKPVNSVFLVMASLHKNEVAQKHRFASSIIQIPKPTLFDISGRGCSPTTFSVYRSGLDLRNRREGNARGENLPVFHQVWKAYLNLMKIHTTCVFLFLIINLR